MMSTKKTKRLVCFFIAVLMIPGVLFTNMTNASAEVSVNISVDTSNYQPITKAKNVGVNNEMSMISDEMWNENGKWMEETFKASGLKIMRWGYDAWAFDWENEVPLSSNKYWGALNTKDAAGTFGLYEFIEYCKTYDVIPFIMIPIESLDTVGGTATLQRVKDLTTSMANYVNSQGITEAYFDMGNEPWNTHTQIDAAYYGGLFSQFYPLIKNANPNYKLVLQRAPENILWSNWNRTAESHAAGYFDAYDDHRYAFYDWNAYYDKNNDDFFTPGPSISGKEGLLGECNIGWTWRYENWQAGHTKDLGGGMALLNALLDIINKDVYTHVLTWPSHYPSKNTVPGSPDSPFGWFDLDAWYSARRTQRLTGPMLAHLIVNQNVLEYKASTTSSSSKVRTFAYTDSQKSVIKLIVINKGDPANTTISIPSGYGYVNGSIMKGNSVWDVKPVYVNKLSGNVAINGTTFTDTIPGECVVVYTFFNDNTVSAPGSFQLVSPANGDVNVSGAKTFEWTASEGATNYRLVVSKNANLSNPVLDVYVGNFTHYQTMRDLDPAVTYYWKVDAINKNGTTAATNNNISFTTATQIVKVWNDDSYFISYSKNWNDQDSNGCYNNDDHSSKTTNAYAEFTFTGTKAKIYGIKGDWCGKADIQLNGTIVATVDTYAATTQQQVLFHDTGVLPYGTHTVMLRVRGDKNPSSNDSWIEFDKVEIINDANIAPASEMIVRNDDDQHMTYSYGWTHQAFGGCYHNDDHATNTWNAYVEFTFTGAQAKIYGVKGNWCGKVDVQLNGVTVATVDTYAATTQDQALWYDTGVLPYGTYTMKIKRRDDKNPASSGKWIEFDKVEILVKDM